MFLLLLGLAPSLLFKFQLKCFLLKDLSLIMLHQLASFPFHLPALSSSQVLLIFKELVYCTVCLYQLKHKLHKDRDSICVVHCHVHSAWHVVRSTNICQMHK
jgi:hypothetical protein